MSPDLEKLMVAGTLSALRSCFVERSVVLYDYLGREIYLAPTKVGDTFKIEVDR